MPRLLSIHVPAPEGPAPPATRLPSLLRVSVLKTVTSAPAVSYGSPATGPKSAGGLLCFVAAS